MHGGQIGTGQAERRVRYRDALGNRHFAVLFAAEAQSIVGDQLARVALAVLVYEHSGSAAATGLVFAATYLPAIAGSSVLGHLADRYSRRQVMITVDVVRAALVTAMAVGSTQLWPLLVLLVASVFVGPLFGAAQVSYLAGALSPEVFRVGTGLRMVGSQGAQVAGFAVGGALVGAVGPRLALAIDAATFVLSAVLVASAIGRDRRPGATAPEGGDPRTAHAALWGRPPARRLVSLSALAGFFVVPEGVAVPFADRTGGSATAAGVLLAALPLGSVVGVLLLHRVPRRARRRTAAAMAVACGVPLVVSGVLPDVRVAAACWVLSGALAAYQLEVLTEIVQLIPDAVRGRSMGICSAVLLGAQGIGIAVFGAVAQGLGPAGAVGIAGALGTGCAALLVVRKPRGHREPHELAAEA